MRLLALLVPIAAWTWLVPAAVAAERIVGQATVIDGDTLEIHGRRIRLFGIDAPESTQLCRDGDGRSYRCGAIAANALAAMIGRRSVSCTPVDRDRYGRIVATCLVAGSDAAAWMAHNGLAIDFTSYSGGQYQAEESGARTRRTGLWSGSWVPPSRYRRCMRNGGGSPSRCSAH